MDVSAVTQILVVTDSQRSKDFWVNLLGATIHREYGDSIVLGFYGTWLLLVPGGDPTPDKPRVTLETPTDPRRVSHAMTLRVANCQAAYEELRDHGAQFLTPPYDWGAEVRCFVQDPDGHLVELSEVK